MNTFTTQLTDTLAQLDSLRTIIHQQQTSINKLTDVLTRLEPILTQGPSLSPHRKTARTMKHLPPLSPLRLDPLTPPPLEDKSFSYQDEPPDILQLSPSQQ